MYDVHRLQFIWYTNQQQMKLIKMKILVLDESSDVLYYHPIISVFMLSNNTLQQKFIFSRGKLVNVTKAYSITHATGDIHSKIILNHLLTMCYYKIVQPPGLYSLAICDETV